MTDQPRVIVVNDRPVREDGRYVLYWMQHSQRAHENPALERAVSHANDLDLPLLVLFVVDPSYPEANARHYTFMLEGLKETMADIRSRGAHMALRLGHPPDVAAEVARDAAVVVTDRGYLRHLAEWRIALGKAAPCTVETVEGDVLVPVEEASQKRETAARTIRPKLMRAASEYAERPTESRLARRARGLKSDDDVELGSIPRFIEMLGCDTSVGPVDGWKGGTKAARARLKAFVEDGLAAYGEGRADIVDRNVSGLSPYVHFGQISPVEIALAVRDARGPDDETRRVYLEELIVRRELAINHAWWAPADYDSYDGLPDWARLTLEAHEADPRP